MAISTFDQYVASVKQIIPLYKSASRTTVANQWFSVFELAGTPGAGVLAGTSTTVGVVPTSATAGVPIINFATGLGYLTNVDFGNTVSCRMKLYDMLFKAGAYSFNSAATLTTQPSYSSRVPGGTDFTGLQLWYEQVTAGTGIQTVTVTYTNQAGTTARTTGAFSIGVAGTLGRMIQIPLQSGDSGIQKIESVTGTVATVGTFNILIMRPLWTGRVRLANDGDVHSIDVVGAPQVWATSAITLIVNADSTSSGNPEFEIEVASA